MTPEPPRRLDAKATTRGEQIALDVLGKRGKTSKPEVIPFRDQPLPLQIAGITVCVFGVAFILCCCGGMLTGTLNPTEEPVQVAEAPTPKKKTAAQKTPTPEPYRLTAEQYAQYKEEAKLKRAQVMFNRVPYVVVSDDITHVARKRAIVYRFTTDQLPSKQQMIDMSAEVELETPGLLRYFVVFLLPGMRTGSGAFATCHRTPEHPDGQLMILGLQGHAERVGAFYDE